MNDRIWHKGPPPHVGWWNASVSKDPYAWRWWNGKRWSYVAYPGHGPRAVRASAATPVTNEGAYANIQWTTYWPEGARVPRVKPRDPADWRADSRHFMQLDAAVRKQWEDAARKHVLHPAVRIDPPRTFASFQPDYPEAELGHLAPPAPPPWVRPYYDDKRFPPSYSSALWEGRFLIMLDEIASAPEAERKAVADDVLTFVCTVPAALRYLFVRCLARYVDVGVLSACLQSHKCHLLFREGRQLVKFFKTLPEKLS